MCALFVIGKNTIEYVLGFFLGEFLLVRSYICVFMLGGGWRCSRMIEVNVWWLKIVILAYSCSNWFIFFTLFCFSYEASQCCLASNHYSGLVGTR